MLSPKDLKEVLWERKGVTGMELAWRTHAGKVRKQNEDSIGLVRTKSGTLVAIIADGMGGHQGGEVASRHAVQVIEREIKSLSQGAGIKEIGERMKFAITLANQEIYHMASQKSELRGMGTTVVSAVIGSDQIVIGHVGDSRAYLLHNNGLYQLTEDHSLVNVLRKHGQITEKEAARHPQRNVIARAVGSDKSVEVDQVITPWFPNDTLLLCTDGLTDLVEERHIGTILTSDHTLEEQADRLLAAALAAGGNDNISLILIRQTKGSRRMERPEEKRGDRTDGRKEARGTI